jgi:hypothetical protein
MIGSRKSPTSLPTRAYAEHFAAMEEQARNHQGYRSVPAATPFPRHIARQPDGIGRANNVEIDEIVSPGPRQQDMLAAIEPLRGSRDAAPYEVEIDDIVSPGPRQQDMLSGIVPLGGAAPPASATTPAAAKPAPAPAAAKPITALKKGVYNNMDVKRLQTALTDIAAFLRMPGVDPEGVDGDFGDNTADALKAYQTVMRLPVTGVADAATLSAIYDHRRHLSKGEGTDLRAGETNIFGESPLVKTDFSESPLVKTDFSESPLVKTNFGESSPYARPRR